ncbi:MAG: hypothetical protein K8I30_18635 [Anaerolineae bacterium]|nr:hypothetical protein [Anaerolineae bacterium]
MEQVGSAVEAAAVLKGARYVNAELMYQPRPVNPRERIVFDYTLTSRLKQLEAQDAVLFICDERQTVESLEIFQVRFPHLRMVAAIANPPLWSGQTTNTPQLLKWESPENWQRYAITDRWARIDFALDVCGLLDTPGYLLMPAHDAVWGKGLLAYLEYTSQLYAKNGLHAAVSPYIYYQHYPVPGAHIPRYVIDLMNTAFGRDFWFPWKIRLERVQAFWGKMSMTPFAMCAAIRERVQKDVWEDDLEIDGAIRRLGFGMRCRWVSDPALYHQSPPVFDEAGLRKVIERTLHYSLNIPSAEVGASTLNFPLDSLGRLWRRVNPRFARNNAEAEALIDECNAVIRDRLVSHGASWVDWGAYRYVTLVGQAEVEVWKRGSILV